MTFYLGLEFNIVKGNCFVERRHHHDTSVMNLIFLNMQQTELFTPAKEIRDMSIVVAEFLLLLLQLLKNSYKMGHFP